MSAGKVSGRRGVLLAGGVNSRLYPVTRAVAKSLLPVYDKPLIYYSLSALMLAGIREVLVIVAPGALAAHRRLLGDGSAFGLRLSYAVQKKPRGIADAFLIGRDFIDGAPCALALADNIFCGAAMTAALRGAAAQTDGACVFAYRVADPERFGVVEFDAGGRVLSLAEKPTAPKSSYAVVGFYCYDGAVCELAQTLAPSERGELEITDLNALYLRRGALTAQRLDESVQWFDAGTAASLAAASDFVRQQQAQTGEVLACPEGIAYAQGWIDRRQLRAQARRSDKTDYGAYLRRLSGLAN